MSQGPRTFRDPFLSVYQSMMSDIAKANSPGAALEAADDEDAPKPDEIAAAELVAARSAVAAMTAGHRVATRLRGDAGLAALASSGPESVAPLPAFFLEAALIGPPRSRRSVP